MECEPDQRFSRRDDSSGWQVVEFAAINRNILPKVSLHQPAHCRNGFGGQQNLPERHARNAAGDAIRAAIDDIRTLSGAPWAAFTNSFLTFIRSCPDHNFTGEIASNLRRTFKLLEHLVRGALTIPVARG